MSVFKQLSLFVCRLCFSILHCDAETVKKCPFPIHEFKMSLFFIHQTLICRFKF